MDAFRLAFASLFAPTACLSLSKQPFSRLRPHNRELRPAPMPPIPRETMRRLHKTTQAGTIVLGDGGRAYLDLSVESLQKPSVPQFADAAAASLRREAALVALPSYLTARQVDFSFKWDIRS